MFAVTIHSDFGAPWNKVCHCFHCFPIYLPWSDGTGCSDLSFLNVEPAFSLSSFTFIRRLFSSSLLSAIRVVSSSCLRLLIFLPAILILLEPHPAWHFAWCTLHISEIYNLDVLLSQPWHTPFVSILWQKNLEVVTFRCPDLLISVPQLSQGADGQCQDT